MMTREVPPAPDMIANRDAYLEWVQKYHYRNFRESTLQTARRIERATIGRLRREQYIAETRKFYAEIMERLR